MASESCRAGSGRHSVGWQAKCMQGLWVHWMRALLVCPDCGSSFYLCQCVHAPCHAMVN